MLEECHPQTVERALYQIHEGFGIINELLDGPYFASLLKHEYGNYVITTAMKNYEDEVLLRLVRVIEDEEDSLEGDPNTTNIRKELKQFRKNERANQISKCRKHAL
ncbi:hypothetical protein AMTR_s00088p00168300 [Amborella trichopoda]|uniref:PUM-HD domain-containing protein n=1 Tax=Amborella trichopoda TaxID=13333 RepID=W1NRL1_AMBTC|nr:hypothetical protein AMTR_s00088p00168300 [Amborella trichopoda]